MLTSIHDHCSRVHEPELTATHLSHKPGKTRHIQIAPTVIDSPLLKHKGSGRTGMCLVGCQTDPWGRKRGERSTVICLKVDGICSMHTGKLSGSLAM